MGKLKDTAGFAVTEVLVALLVLIALAFTIHFVTHRGSHNNTTVPSGAASPTTTAPAASNTANPYAILSPATVPSKTAECSQQLTFTSNGDPNPVTCANGDLNILEWNALAALEPSVFKLGYNATAAQVQSALCADVSANVSNPSELSSYQIASLYYGWSFTSNPGVVLTNGTCQNVDD